MDFHLTTSRPPSPTSPAASSPSSCRRSGSARSRPTADWFAADVWAELAKADLLGLCLPEAVGGGGYGLFEAALRAASRSAAPSRPCRYFATLVLGALPIAEFGTDAQQAALLPGVIAGSTTADRRRSSEAGDGAAARACRPPRRPPTATAGGSTARRRSCRRRTWPAASSCPARTGDGDGTVFLVDPPRRGVDARASRSPINVEPQSRRSASTAWPSTPTPCSARSSEGARDRRVDHRPGRRRPLRHAGRRVRGALRTHRHATCPSASSSARRSAPSRPSPSASPTPTSTPRPSASPRCQAAWRLGGGPATPPRSWPSPSSGRPTAPHRVVHAAQHLHGGIGVDLDYPIHRYFRWAKDIELTLGGGTTHLRRLGDLIAAG